MKLFVWIMFVVYSVVFFWYFWYPYGGYLMVKWILLLCKMKTIANDVLPAPLRKVWRNKYFKEEYEKLEKYE